MEEAADQIAILESRLSLRDDLEQGLMDGVARLQAEVERLRNGALDGRETVRQGLSQKNNCPAPDNAANADILTDDEREAVSWCVEMALSFATDCDDEIATLRGLLERL
jgi:hypothetical protein